MTLPLRLPDRRGYSSNDRAIEHWAREMLSHAGDHALGGSDPATAFPVFLGRLHKIKASSNTYSTLGTWTDMHEFSLAVTKKRADTSILVTWALTMQPDATGRNAQIAVRLGGVDNSPTPLINVDQGGGRSPPWKANALVSGLAAGTHTVQMRINPGTGNWTTYVNDDYCALEVWEVPA